MKLMDYLFELTEFSDNEGEQILVEEYSLESAWHVLTANYGFQEEELEFVEEIEVWEGEMLGLDTY